MGRHLDAPSGLKQIGAGLANYGAGSTITSDVGQYILTSAQPEAETPIYPLTTGQVIEIWQAPRMRTVGDRTWAVFSVWVARRSDLRMQIVVVPFDEDGPGEPAIVTKARPLSVWPDLAVETDGTQRAVWVEPLGNDMYQVVVASTADKALETLGGVRLAEVLNDVATFALENLSLLLGAYGLFIGLDALFTIFIRVPRFLWRP